LWLFALGIDLFFFISFICLKPLTTQWLNSPPTPQPPTPQIKTPRKKGRAKEEGGKLKRIVSSWIY